ncbi:MAG: ribonuclease H-like domain-containing protein [Candidatus Omnitrophica bacterium]|nr:ribonuclease H-like domain-containing protein [Candidatus Omnitrophota bacterium]
MADLYERLKRFNQNTTDHSSSARSETPTPSSSPLPESLRRIPGLARGRDLIGIAEKRGKDKKRFLESIGVEEKKNDHGAYGYRQVFYPLEKLIHPPHDISGEELALLTRDQSLASISWKDILFFDTETTGLAGGTGTLPFLVGVGFFEEEGFRIQQFLMRDYDEECAVLFEIQKLIAQFSALASYNGKCFDAPILHSRFLLNRFPSTIHDIPHADLLFPARRFWRDLLPDCTLLTVEAYLTGLSRIDDIPGEQIPYVYFDFIRGLRMERMRPVLHHNADDILTLALIASRTCRMLRLPPPPMHGLELAAAGRCFAATSQWDLACWYLEKAGDQKEISDQRRFIIYKQLSLFLKRQMRFKDACEIWELMRRDYADPFALIELSKYYEHKEKDFLQALSLAEQAMDLIQQNAPISKSGLASGESLYEQLRIRRNRLKRKSAEIEK